MAPTTHHYLLYDRSEGHLRITALHHVLDSALACFGAFRETGSYEQALLLTRITTDQYGITVREIPILMLSKESGRLHDYRTGETTDSSGGRPPPIRAPTVQTEP